MKTLTSILTIVNGKFMLSERLEKDNIGQIQTPGGLLEEDEAPWSGALREFREETGLEILDVDYLGYYLHSEDLNGAPTHLCFYFCANLTQDQFDKVGNPEKKCSDWKLYQDVKNLNLTFITRMAFKMLGTRLPKDLIQGSDVVTGQSDGVE